MKLISDFDVQKLCEVHSPKLWGEKYPEFSPKICKIYLGDGKQLIWFQTCDQRPYWWWVRIDSSMDVNIDDFPCLEIYDLIEDEFGRIAEEGDEDYNEEEYGDVNKCYPMILSNDGVLWGSQGLLSESAIKQIGLNP